VERWRFEGRAEFIYFSYHRDPYKAFPWLREIRWGRIGKGIHSGRHSTGGPAVPPRPKPRRLPRGVPELRERREPGYAGRPFPICTSTWARSCPHAASMSRPRVSRTAASTPRASSPAANARMRSAGDGLQSW
jgi:hypothetical protein